MRLLLGAVHAVGWLVSLGCDFYGNRVMFVCLFVFERLLVWVVWLQEK